MEQLLAFLTKYGLFIGIVIGTILFFWATYAIYNAIVRAKQSKNVNHLITTNTIKPIEKSEEIQREIKTPSLEGDNVIKTGPRKMSVSVDDDDEPIIASNKAPVEIATEKRTEEAPEKEMETLTDPILPVNQDISNPVSILKPENDTKETNVISVQPSEEKKEHEIKPIGIPKEHRKIPLPAEDAPSKRIVQTEEKKTTKKPVKTTESSVNPEPKVIKVDTLTPKPKKKSPPKYHVLYRSTDNTWYVKVEGSENIIGTLETQREAISFATIKALKSDSVVIVHRKDGKIRKQATMEDVIDSDEDE